MPVVSNGISSVICHAPPFHPALFGLWWKFHSDHKTITVSVPSRTEECGNLTLFVLPDGGLRVLPKLLAYNFAREASWFLPIISGMN